jgi:hypothetical protein
MVKESQRKMSTFPSRKMTAKKAEKRVGVFLSIPAKFERWVGNVDYGPAIRQEAIDRWNRLGFDVYSINSVEESEELEPYLKEVTLIRVVDERRVKISAIAAAIQSTKVDVAIIANADCIVTEFDMIESAIDHLGDNQLCLVERTNIDPVTLRTTGLPCEGFDAFIVSSKVLACIPEGSPWRIGDTWWDYWFPFHCKKNGVRISNLGSPALLHLNHEMAWDWENWLKNAKLFFSETPVGSDVFDGNFNVKYGNADVASDEFQTFSPRAKDIYEYLRMCSDTTSFEELNGFAKLQSLILRANYDHSWSSNKIADVKTETRVRRILSYLKSKLSLKSG